MELAAQEQVVSLHVALGTLADDLGIGRQQRAPQRPDHLRGNVVLDGEDVVELAVVGVGPQVIAGACVDELRRHPNPVILAPHAALEDIRHAEPLANAAQVLVLALESERGSPPRDAEILDPRQHVQDLLRQALGEVLIGRILRHVDEGQYRDGEVPGCCGRVRRRRRRWRGRLRSRRGAVAEHVPGQQRDGQHQQRDGGDIELARRFLGSTAVRREIAITTDAFRRDFESPGQHQGEGEAQREHDGEQAQGTLGRFDDAEQHVRHLEHDPGARAVEQGDADDVAAL